MTFDESLMISSDFLQEYKVYLSKFDSQPLKEFLDNIDTNKKYYRMSIHKNKRYSKAVAEDTNKIKKIISQINKLTESNYDSLSIKIIQLVDEDYLIPYIIETLVEYSLTHHIYIPLYVGLLKRMLSIQTKPIIERYCNKFYNKVFSDEIINAKQSSYLNLCDKNKKTDNIIGFSLFITHIEENKILTDQISKVLSSFMENILKLDKEDDIYKMLISFHNISEIKFKKGIPEIYIQQLKELKNKQLSSKIKFKIMDILGE
jgi:hypothetical protein